jgi:hypothetical protein
VIARILAGDEDPMNFVFMAVGLLATAAGFVTIGFGIPINAFSLGNTLIVAGAIAVVGGLILMALASAIGHLKRLTEALKGTALARVGRAGELAETPAAARAEPPPVAGRAGLAKAPELPERSLPDLHAFEQQLAPEPPRAPERRQPEPHFPTTAAEVPGPLDWLRARSKPAGSTPQPAAQSPVVEVPDEAPLSPRPPQRPAMPAAAEPAIEAKMWPPARDLSTEPRSAPRVELPMPRGTPQPEPAKDKDRFGFDLVWPDRPVHPPAAPQAPAAPATVTPAPMLAPEPAKREPALDMPMPPIPVRPRETSQPPERRPEPARKPAERGPAILKSGVIDGMPYTLYADGSIEAQLPQGTVKFASVDALRAHLEKQG